MQINPIAYIKSPYKQKFAIPRQPNLVKEAVGELILAGDLVDAVRGLEQFSHLWLIFAFHENADKGWSPLVRPPRLGGKEKMGVFATRATFRPNSLGLSAVELISIESSADSITLKVRGLDLLDGTPIYDIKPYVPYADSIPTAKAGFANASPEHKFAVYFHPQVMAQIPELELIYPDIKAFITNVLGQDPRPAYRQGLQEDKVYGINLYDLNIRWQIQEGAITVLEIQQGEDNFTTNDSL